MNGNNVNSLKKIFLNILCPIKKSAHRREFEIAQNHRNRAIANHVVPNPLGMHLATAEVNPPRHHESAKLDIKPELYDALAHFIKNHYSAKRVSYDGLKFVIDGVGTRKKWINMTINEMISVVQLQFGHGSGAILKELNALKHKDRRGGGSTINLVNGWCKAGAQNLKTAVLGHSHFCSGQYSTVHGPSHAIGAMLLSQWLANELRKRGHEVSSRDKFIAGLAAIGHDSGRQTEGRDVDEWGSAWNMRNYLSGSPTLQKYAEDTYDTIMGKDSGGGRNGQTMAHILLHDSDCLEIIRCVGSRFDMDHLDVVRLNLIPKKDVENMVKKVRNFLQERGNDTDAAYQKYYTRSNYYVSECKRRIDHINSIACKHGIGR
ncbi:MAG: hypothetical protein LBI56_04310 [Puniceicoccales bacterium]|jgi:hypothetical protein|nr:hypothetical protein [Puniceicoccales bacterium]